MLTLLIIIMVLLNIVILFSYFQKPQNENYYYETDYNKPITNKTLFKPTSICNEYLKQKPVLSRVNIINNITEYKINNVWINQEIVFKSCNSNIS